MQLETSLKQFENFLETPLKDSRNFREMRHLDTTLTPTRKPLALA